MKQSENLTFEELALKAIRGENPQELATKIKRKAKSALEAQIALQKANIVDLEDKIAEVETNQALALVNHGKGITNNSDYVEAILEAESAVEDAKFALEHCNKTIEVLEAKLAVINGEGTSSVN